MDLRQLKYFVAVARNGSFSKASLHLHVSQPAISEQIAALEVELGVKLFTRHSRGIMTTPQGLSFLARAEQALELLETAKEELARENSAAKISVRLGLPTTITAALAIPLLEKSRQQLPRVSLKIVEGMTGHLEGWLDNGDLDLAVLFGRPSDPAASLSRRFGYEKLYLIGHATPAVEHLDAVEFQDLVRLPLIHSTSGHQLRQLLDQRAAALREPLNLIAEIDSLPQIKNLVFQGSGFTILPRTSLLRDWIGGRVRYWPIVDPDCVLSLHLLPSAKFLRLPGSAEVVSTIESLMRILIERGDWLTPTEPRSGEASASAIS
ncbi:LysR family transcriptional regulator [Alsobacter sp. R-9]